MPDDLTIQRRRALHTIAKPFGFLFWGAVLALVDVWFRVGLGGNVTSVDLVPDWLGFGLIAAGMGILAYSGLLSGADDTAVTVAGAVFLTLCLLSVGSCFAPRLAELPPGVAVLLELVGAAAVVAFCVAMARLASELGLSSVARSWAWIAVAVFTLYTLPQLLVALVPALTPVVAVASTVLVIVLAIGLLRTAHRMRSFATGPVPADWRSPEDP